MASLRLFTLSMIVASTLVAFSESTVLCPGFPTCCYSETCHILCPSCREADVFKHGIRKKKVFESILEENAERQEKIDEIFERTGIIPGTRQAFRRARRPGVSFIQGGPFAIPDGQPFPNALVVL